jgi:hypothetical protein
VRIADAAVTDENVAWNQKRGGDLGLSAQEQEYSLGFVKCHFRIQNAMLQLQFQTSNLNPQTPNPKPQTPSPEPQAPNANHQPPSPK